MQIGEVARLTNVSVDTVRHYERQGLLNNISRTASGYRVYSSDAVEQIRLIRSALDVGFTIAELSRIFKTRHAGGAPCAEVRTMAGVKLRDLERDIAKMQSLRRELRTLIRRWDGILKTTRPGQPAHLLQVLVSHKSKGDRK
jgi:DNA-binding transcriptional MerR regulator